MKPQKKKEILKVAKKLIVEKGFMETSIRDIALELKLQPSSLYNHFQSKESIMEAICDDVRERFQKILRDISESNHHPRIKFHEFLRRYVVEMLSDEQAYIIYSKYFNYNDKLRLNYLEGQRLYLEFVEHLINEVHPQENGKVLSKGSAAMFLLAALNTVPKVINSKTNPNIDFIVEDFYNILIYGLIDRPS